ncbi:hypothetical protein MY5147_005251 [Beauveria neobassiana]
MKCMISLDPAVTGGGLVVVTVAHLVALLAQSSHAPSIVAIAFSLAAAIGVVLLSSVYHQRSLTSSRLLVLYLLVSGCWNLSAVLEVMAAHRLRRLMFFPPVTGANQLTLLVLECTSKQDIFLPMYKALAPVETANLFSAVSFWWMNKLLLQGNKHIFQNEDMPPLDSQLKAAGLNKIIKHAWSTRARPETKTTLCKVLLKTHTRQFITTMIPRLFMVLFECSQPLLIKAIIRYVESPHRQSSCYERYLNCSTRAQLEKLAQSLVYHKTLATAEHAADTGKATTVMSTDVDAIAQAPSMFHDLVGRILEVTFGLLILGDQVKWLWPVPLVIIFFCSQVSRFVAKNIGRRQRNWNEATERRMTALGSILGSMKSVKALGITEALLSYVADLRKVELLRAGEKRFMDCQYNSSANALGVFSPAITVALFAIISHVKKVPLDTAVLFTTVAALTIVTHPANMIMTIYPRIISISASFERFQESMIASPLKDTRQVDQEDMPVCRHNRTAISLTDVSVYGRNDQPILTDIDMKLRYGSVTICCGSIGSGKSVLGKAILGELHAARDLVEVSSKRVGFCDQTPWIMAGTVKEVICAFASPVDEERYRAVVKACCLDLDLGQFQDGDALHIGSRGVNLSGGQKQRISLARLLYSGEAVVVLDDSFAALDGATESQVIQNLIGPAGWLRRNGVAVLWITNAAQYFRFADHVIMLENGRITHRGTAEQMRPFVSELRKFHAEDEAYPAHEAPARLAKTKAKKDAQNDLYRQTGDMSLYTFYFKSTGVVAPLAVVGATATYAVFNTRSGSYLHNALAIRIFGAPLSYFVATDIGVTLNRFGQDIDLVDRLLPNSFARFATQCCKMAAQIIVMSLVQTEVAFAVPVCAVVVYFVQRVYLQTSRQLRVLDLEAKASLYSGFHETFDGLPTIRAFGWQAAVEQRNIDAVDLSMRPVFLIRCLNRWLLIVLELIVNTVAIAIVLLSVMGGDERGTRIGVALNLVILTNKTLIALVLGFTDLEVSLGAISRLKTVDESPILDQSSLSVVALAVDWWNILNIPRSIVRSRCFIAVPQDGIMFKDASLRFNLDPTTTVNDENLRGALESTDLWTVFSGAHDQAADILDQKLSSLAPLSAGQQQLFALARAVAQKHRARPYSDSEELVPCRRSKPIVLLDELTAFMDSATETKVYNVVEREFVEEGHTVVIVSHRLDGLLGRLRQGRDAVAVLKDGRRLRRT